MAEENLKKEFFGDVRFINILGKNEKKEDEIFFSIEGSKGKRFGYMKKTKEIEDLIKNHLFTGCTGIEFIEWDSCWNVVFEEAYILGSVSRKMDFNEFHELFRFSKEEK